MSDKVREKIKVKLINGEEIEVYEDQLEHYNVKLKLAPLKIVKPYKKELTLKLKEEKNE